MRYISNSFCSSISLQQDSLALQQVILYLLVLINHAFD